MTRALEAQLRRYRDQPYTPSALRERITALPGRVEHRGDDWWLVGQIIDTIVDRQLEVLCRPPRLRLREISRPAHRASDPSFIAEDAEPMGPPRYWKKASAAREIATPPCE